MFSCKYLIRFTIFSNTLGYLGCHLRLGPAHEAIYHYRIGCSLKKKIMVVYGTRPEAIKVAPLIQAMADDRDMDVIPVVTGQHREMLDQVNEVFGIVPVANLEVFSPGQGLNELTGKIFSNIDSMLDEIEPDAVLVQGDTTSVMAAAIASFYRRIPVVHLEAGLRSHNLFSPFPEEANRKIVSQVASLHLAPTLISRENLVKEGIPQESIAVTGNTVVDALLLAVKTEHISSDPKVNAIIGDGRRVVLVTTHRRENWGEAMTGLGKAVRILAEKFSDFIFVLPLHKNPIVREAILPHLRDTNNVFVTEPLPYSDFTQLLNRSHVVLTDSGGIQEEAPSLGKPVLVMRENTERPEAVSAGTVKLVGSGEASIVESVSTLLNSKAEYEKMARAVNPYGDGFASERSRAAIAAMLGVGERLPDFNSGPLGN